MSIKQFKPYTPGRRQMTIQGREDITAQKPERSLVTELRKHGGTQAGDVRIPAGRNTDGVGVVMVAAYMWLDLDFTLEIAGLDAFDADVRVTDRTCDMVPAAFLRTGNTLRIDKPSSSAVYLIRLIPRA